ncbi:MAG: segregation and condensation protein A [Alphaproteobacteria bacterium]
MADAEEDKSGWGDGETAAGEGTGVPALDRGVSEQALVVQFEAFEGPLDLLLTLARAQKVDLREISILALAEQYLDYIQELRKTRLELAADYLVMAAWLAFLKSRLIIPAEESDEEGPSGEEMAALLAFRLQRLEAMRKAAAQLFARDQLGRDVFFRGMPEGIRVVRKTHWQASLYDLLSAYGDGRSREALANYEPPKKEVFSMEMALRQLEMIVGHVPDWATLQTFLPEAWSGEPQKFRSALAATFAASLEMVRDGRLELQQSETFGPIYLRSGRGEKLGGPAADREAAAKKLNEGEDHE